jgi:hypothetical protein
MRFTQKHFILIKKELKWFEMFLHVRPVGEAARVRRVVLTGHTDPRAVELRGNKGQGAAMAHLIIVHRNDEEIVVNADHIIFAERIAAAKPAYTNLMLTSDTRLSIRETLDELKGASA